MDNLNRVMRILAFLLMASVYSANAAVTLAPGETIESGQQLTIGADRSLVMQGDGNLVLYGHDSLAVPIWASGTHGNPGATLQMQADGNLAIRAADNITWLWTTETYGNPGATYQMQDDGNLVVYSTPQREALWASGTAGNPGATYALQDNGDLVVSSLDGEVLWSSGTAGNPDANYIMQGDGNLVIYTELRQQSLWATNTAGNPGAELLMLENGNLVLFDSAGVEIWSSDTAGNPGATYVMQEDGNLVIYDVDGEALWASNTNDNAGAELVLQEDGNLVIYSQPFRVALWASDTYGNPGATLEMQDDGNLVIYSQPKEVPLWASQTVGHVGATLEMQTDGNLVISTAPIKKPLWASGTQDNFGASAIMQADGNFVVYNTNGDPLWASNTYQAGSELRLQDDGNLVLYNTSSEPLWATNTLLPWMTRMGSAIEGLPLTELVIPGTHDSGTYALDDTRRAHDGNISKTLFAADRWLPSHLSLSGYWGTCKIKYTGVEFRCWKIRVTRHARISHRFAKAQSQSIWEQLNGGIRYFDLRVVNQDGLRFAHGLLGNKVLPVISDIARFSEENPKEIIILDFQGLYEMDWAAHNHLLYQLYYNLGDKIVSRSLGYNATVGDVWASDTNIIVMYPRGYNISRELPVTLWQSDTAQYPGASLTMQSDGNLVLQAADNSVVWQTGTWGNPGATYAMQPDGNLVVSDVSGNPLWASGTHGSPGSRLVLRNNGNLVIIPPVPPIDLWNRDNKLILWSSGTYADPESSSSFAMEADGNLVIRDAGNVVIWSTNTAGNPGATYNLENGNLVIRDISGGVLWQSDTAGYPGAVLAMQPDGNLVVSEDSVIRSKWPNKDGAISLMSFLESEAEYVTAQKNIGEFNKFWVLQGQVTPSQAFKVSANIDQLISYLSKLAYGSLAKAATFVNPILHSKARFGDFGGRTNIIIVDHFTSDHISTVIELNLNKSGAINVGPGLPAIAPLDPFSQTLEGQTRLTVPVVTPPPSLLVEADTTNLMPVDLGIATAIDPIDGDLPVTNDISGPFALGFHSIVWSATDAAGITGEAIQEVLVRDSTAPVLTSPADISIGSAQELTAVNIGQASATDVFPVTVTNDAPSLFPSGTTIVIWTASDANGNTSSAEQAVTIIAPTPNASRGGGSIVYYELLAILLTCLYRFQHIRMRKFP